MKRHGGAVAAVVVACGLFLAALSGAADAAKAPPDDEVLLLGLRSPKGFLSTCLIDGAEIQCWDDALAVPGESGWWRMAVTRQTAVSGEGKFSFTYSVTSASVARLPGELFPDGELNAVGCGGDVTDTILFVGGGLASRETKGDTTCRGAAHPAHWVTLDTRSLYGYAASEAVDLGDVLGPEAVARLLEDGAAAREKDDAGEALTEPSSNSWGLVRSRGRWALRGGLTHGSEVARGMYLHYSVRFDVPDRFTGATKLPVPWDQLVKTHPGITDAVASPTGKFLVLVRPEGLVLEAGGKKVATHDAKGAAIVMTQAAQGERAARWREEAGVAAYGEWFPGWEEFRPAD